MISLISLISFSAANLISLITALGTAVAGIVYAFNNGKKIKALEEGIKVRGETIMHLKEELEQERQDSALLRKKVDALEEKLEEGKTKTENQAEEINKLRTRVNLYEKELKEKNKHIEKLKQKLSN